MNIPRHFINTIFAFWAGFVSAISFMEAWLKFRADGVTREIGLGIGKLVFTALNRVEIVLFITVWILFIVKKYHLVFHFTVLNLMFWMVSLIFLVQTFWLVPALLHRAELIISGIEPPASSEHFIFMILEPIKVILLLILSIKFKYNTLKP